MKKLLIMLVGPSGSGKSTLEKNLAGLTNSETGKSRYHKAVSSTTRALRVNDQEVDGVSYFFCQKEGEDRGLPVFDPSLMIENVEFAGNFYGVPLSEIIRDDEKDTVFVVEPHGVLQITQFIQDNYNDTIQPFIIYLDIPLSIRVDNMVKARGDDAEVCRIRLEKDNIEEKFAEFGLKADLNIKKLDKNLHLHVDEFLRLYKKMYF